MGFNVRPDPSARENADRMGVDIRLYRIIYECIEEMEAAMKGLLAPKYAETCSRAQVRQIFKVSSVGTIAGCYVQDGKIARSAKVGWCATAWSSTRASWLPSSALRTTCARWPPATSAASAIDRFNDIREGDIIEAYIMEQVKE